MSVFSKYRKTDNIKQGALFGIELELEGVEQDDVPDLVRRYATVTNDGSLRNGIEIVTAPLSLSEVARFAKAYASWAAKASPILSERTSTHIHVNVQDMEYEQLRSFLWLSVACESVLLEYCSTKRRNNTYCYPTSKTTNTVSWYRELLLRSKEDNLSGSFLRNAPKYLAVGMFRFHDYGTVEFRMFDATTDGATLCGWCDMIDSLRSLAIDHTVEQLRDRKQQEGVLSLLTQAIIAHRGEVPDERLEFILNRGIEMANDIVTPVLTLEQIMAKHAELFPERATEVIIRGQFGAKLLTLSQEDLEAYLRKFTREEFEEEYGGNALYTLFTEMASNPVQAANVVVTVRNVYRFN